MNALTGIGLLVFAAVVLGATADLQTLTAGEIGPGFFPRLCAILLAIIAFMLLMTGVQRVEGESDPQRRGISADVLRAAAIIGSVLLFAVLLQPAGLGLALLTSTWVSTRAAAITPRTAAGLSLALAVALTAFFTLALRLHMPPLPGFLR